MGLGCGGVDGDRMGCGEVRYIRDGLWLWDGCGIDMGLWGALGEIQGANREIEGSEEAVGSWGGLWGGRGLQKAVGV